MNTRQRNRHGQHLWQHRFPWPGCSGLRNDGLAAVFVLAFLAWGIPACAILPLNVGKPVASDPAPAWELKNLDGELVKSFGFLGKVVILDFWVTWCAPGKAVS